MILYPDCDFYNDNQDCGYAPGAAGCEACYRWETCINAYMKDKKPIPIEELPKYKGKHVWVQTPGIPKYGREAIVEDVNIQHRTLWLINDFTCHDYGTVWEAYPINEGEAPTTYSS